MGNVTSVPEKGGHTGLLWVGQGRGPHRSTSPKREVEQHGATLKMRRGCADFDWKGPEKSLLLGEGGTVGSVGWSYQSAFKVSCVNSWSPPAGGDVGSWQMEG